VDEIRVRRRVKIVCTLGPASSSPEVIEGMLRAGMDVARLNLAHGTPESHARLIAEVRRLSEKLNLPTGVLLDLPGLKRRPGDIKEAFREHLDFALSMKADLIALSFISSADQVRRVKELLHEKRAEAPIIVKIERAEALGESDEIIGICDGIMVARGDLGLQINIEKVPLAQKELIRKCNHLGRPVITATQMLESMVESPTPTRAEAADVANAVLDGTDALMLSEETAIGKYPVAAVEIMAKIALEAQAAIPYEQILHERWQDITPEVNDATARAACQIASQLNARAIVAFTSSGSTALRVSKYRPRQPILAVTPFEGVVRRLSPVWGVVPVRRPQLLSLDELFEQAAEVAQAAGLAGKGDIIIVTAGLPLAVPGSTNLVKVHRV